MKWLNVSVVVLLLLTIEARSQTRLPITPFSYDPNAYEPVSLNYKLIGKGDTTLLFIHGWNLDQTYWKRQVDRFSANYRVLTPDLAGHGGSGKNRVNWTVESFSRDLQTIIKQENLQKIILVAHSMGGEIALDITMALPNRIIGLIGVDTFKDVSLTVTEQHRNGVDTYVNEFIGHYSERAEAMAKENIVTRDTVIANRVINAYKQADPQIAVAILMNVFPKAAQAKQQLAQLPFPLQIIMSDYQPYKESELKKYCRNGYQIIRIANAGHFPMVEQPEQFNQALYKFLHPGR